MPDVYNWPRKHPAKHQDRVTAFERQVQKLGLKPKQWAKSDRLKYWVEQNCRSRYVPESLLVAWMIDVRPYDSVNE